MTVNYQNKTIVVTGASQGIGRATALYFAQQGANVVAMARNSTALESLMTEIEQFQGKGIACQGDVSQYLDVEAVVIEAKKAFGSIDFWVNNAGLIDPINYLADSDIEAWNKVVDVNLKGVYHGLRAAIPAMLDSGGGTVINMSSGAAFTALEGWSHYCATKAAVFSLTQCGHKEYGDKGINVIGLSPGTVATDMQVSIKESQLNPVSQLDWSNHITPVAVAKAIAYLCSGEGQKFAGTDFSLTTPEARSLVGLS